MSDRNVVQMVWSAVCLKLFLSEICT